MSKGTARDHARTIWFMRLRSALRTAFACTIVSGVTIYGPKFIKSQIKFPTLSYLIVLLILINATTLGHALSGCCHALHATIQVVPLAMLCRWLLAPNKAGGMPVGIAAMAAAAAAFLVVLPKNTHETAKRIALALIAVISTEAVVRTDNTSRGFMNPVHVGASALLGALACLLALTIPFPGLAHGKVHKLCKVYAENASERMDIYLRAFDATDYNTKTELVLQAKPIADMGTKLLQGVKNLQEGMPWEKHWSRSFDVEKILQGFELPLRAMEYSLLSSSHVQTPDHQPPSTDSLALSSQLHKKIKKIRHFWHSDSQDRDEQLPKRLYKPLESTLSTQNFESDCFFFSCVDILLKDTNNKIQNLCEKTESSITEKLKSWILQLSSFKRLRSSIKYSVALGLSVLLSVILEREHAIWASQAVASSFVAGRPAIFIVTNARAQATALGSVYGLICCILFHQTELRLIALLPWIVFATFLKHSKMYGPPGGVSTAVAALFILGRNNNGDTNELAIGRLTSVFIGLFCLLLSELFMQPVRATTLANAHLSLTLVSLREFLKETSFYCNREKCQRVLKFRRLVERQRVLESLVADAESEPGFWYLPFHTPCYEKVAGCLYNVVLLLYVVMYNLEVLSGLQNSGIVERKELNEQLNYELKVLQGTVDSSVERLYLIKSVVATQDKSGNLEAEESRQPGKLTSLITEEVLRFSEEGDSEDDSQLRKRLVQCLGAIRSCITSLRKEIDQIEFCMKELNRWESSSQ